MALKKVRGNLERMFDKNLTDLVRGIRNNKDNEVSIEYKCTGFLVTVCLLIGPLIFIVRYRLSLSDFPVDGI